MDVPEGHMATTAPLPPAALPPPPPEQQKQQQVPQHTPSLPPGDALARYAPSTTAVPVLFGTCGWMEPSLVSCKRFYPASAREPGDRLRHYARAFPSVELDTTNYAIPSAARLRDWAAAVPAQFVFHMKVLGFFATRTAEPSALPRDLRAAWLPNDEATATAAAAGTAWGAASAGPG